MYIFEQLVKLGCPILLSRPGSVRFRPPL